jgi:DNA processing protein
MVDDSSIYSLALSQLSGIGNVTYKRLIGHFGSAREIFEAGDKRLNEIPWIGKEKIKVIISFNGWESIKERIKEVEDKGAVILALEDEEYPERLKKIHDAPPVLYIKGSFTEKDEFPIAVVGSRHASSYGNTSAAKIASGLAEKGITVVSGMARGIDSVAHRAAITTGGRTIAVLGSGIDVVYPPEGRGLYNDIVKKGIVISEFPPGTKPEPSNFPRRNRIISGLSVGVVIIEASETSGALITADLAVNQDREVFAVPGNINSARSKGTNKLIKKGARLVDNAEDILDELKFILGEDFYLESTEHQRRHLDNESLTDEEKKVLESLSTQPVHIDIVIDETGFRSEVVSRILLELELKGFLRQIPGKNFILN